MGKLPKKKKLGQFRSPGAEQYFLRRKKYGPFHWSCSLTYGVNKGVHIRDPLYSVHLSITWVLHTVVCSDLKVSKSGGSVCFIKSPPSIPNLQPHFDFLDAISYKALWVYVRHNFTVASHLFPKLPFLVSFCTSCFQPQVPHFLWLCTCNQHAACGPGVSGGEIMLE